MADLSSGGQSVRPKLTGDVSVRLETPRVIRVVMTGHVSEAQAHILASELDEAILKCGRVETFWDLGELEGYHPLVRKLCTDVLLQRSDQVLSIKVFAVSKLVRMGVAAANLFLKRIRSYDDRASFLVAMREASRGD